jgi:CheY-like chemotaxis protein
LIPDLIYFKDKEGRYAGCNSAFEQYVNASEELILGKTDFDFVDEETANTLRAMDSVFTVVLPLSEISRDSKPKSASLDELSLLYIEGDAVQQSLLERWASDRGWNIEFANDASSGIDAVIKSRYDAILLDVDLPDGFSGLDVKSVFDEMESARAIPVIGFSSKMEKTDIEAALQAGFAAYLTKPVDLAELERMLQTAVRARFPLN